MPARRTRRVQARLALTDDERVALAAIAEAHRRSVSSLLSAVVARFIAAERAALDDKEPDR